MLRKANMQAHALQSHRADQPATNGQNASMPSEGPSPSMAAAGVANGSTPADGLNMNSSDPAMQRATAHPWEFVDEITNVLKTASPLLTPVLEVLAENLAVRFKPTSEEEVYRFIIALLTEALHVSCFVGPVQTAGLSSSQQHSTNRAGNANDDGAVPESCLSNVVRLASGLPTSSRVSRHLATLSFCRC